MRIRPPSVRRATAVAAAVTLIASGATGATAPSASAAGAGATCTPTTRTLDTLGDATPLALGPHGHVVAEDAIPGANSGLWLYRPNGTKTAITYSNGYSPYGVSDVNGRGSVVGTSGVNVGATAAGVPWIGHGATASLLPAPTRPYMPSYFATSINGHGVVAGVATNYPFSSPGKTDFLAAPVVWPDAATNPVDLSMPAGVFAVAFDRGAPLISIRNDGTVSAVLDDYNGGGSYLARWRPAAAAPTLDQLPAWWHSFSVAGRWVVGQIGAQPNDMFVFSPRAAVQLNAPNALTGMHVSANGTYSAVYGPGSIFGRGTAAPRDGIQYGQAIDIVGTDDGTALRADPVGMSVLSCTLGMAEATYIDVTPIVLG